MSRFSAVLTSLAVMAVVSGPAAAASKYGCFKVVSDELNIRDRPYSTATVIGTAKAGEVLEKRKWLCTLRGYWCAVRTQDGAEGYADKAYLEKTDCP